MEYKILFAVGEQYFNDHVTEHLKQGWKLIGGVSVIVVDGEVVYHQAVKK